jgi:hypothetical protein
MKYSNTWFALILIASVSLSSGVKSASAQEAAPTSPPPIPEKSESQPTNDHAIATEQPTHTPPSVISTTKPSQSAPKQNQDQTEESWWWPPLPSSWVLIFITGAYAVISFYTLGAISQQAATARDALEKLERPWIMALPTKFEIVPEIGTALTPRMIRFTYCVQNVGRSPAWIVGGKGRAMKIAKDSLPSIPDYGPLGRPYSPTPTPPNDKGREEAGQIKFSAEEYQALIEGRINFVIFGFMSYRSSIGKEIHETRYCICLEPGPLGLAMAFCGPNSYNRYT